MIAPVARRGWMDDVRAHGPAAVAVAFDLKFSDRGTGSFTCPACAAVKRHPTRRDRRGAAGITRDGGGWRCHECGEGGSAVDLGAWASIRRVPVRGDTASWREVRAACAARGLCEPSADDPDTARVHLRPVPAPRPPPPPARPPATEVAELWGACIPVVDDPGVSAWIREVRGLSPGDVADRDVLRALPPGVPLPSWARFIGRPWTESGHRAIVAMYGPDGVLVSVHARCVVRCEEKDKAASPAGYAIRELVMADRLARMLLAGEPLADGGAAADLIKRTGIWTGEGVPDFVSLATWWSDADEAAPAVLGVINGAWTPEIAARIPDGATLVVAPHADAAGEDYFEKIIATLAPRMRAGLIKVRRWPGGAER